MNSVSLLYIYLFIHLFISFFVSLLQEFEENVIENNGINVAVITAEGKDDTHASTSRFTALRHHHSRGSMDSGCDFLDNVS